MAGSLFDAWVEIYEAMIDWPKRLEHEGPFYRRLFHQVRVRRALDVACGTGRHAGLFHSWGLEVEGADVSPAMIQRARERFGQDDRLRWVVRGFDESIRPPQPLDAIICVGNSLALAPDRATMAEALRQWVAALRPGGVVVVHVLNLWQLAEGACRWQKHRRAELDGVDVFIHKGVHRCGDRGFVEVLVVPLDDPGAAKSQSQVFWGVEADQLEKSLVAAGAARVECFGGYQGQAYRRLESSDLVVVAVKEQANS
ncbi:MAG TPA: class I SAM-dependent methyltransferase [Planctomycetaceae bacterium]|nr:class I SAM-dependent methyltransferase [Planctomycetaceae bacterium]HIQ21440.1 class I SAM-dependent methyltransferase [Planctomycetota bacterium]